MSETAGFRGAHHPSLRDYLATIRRRKWIIAQAVVLVPVAAVALSLHQQKLFRAHAEVLLSQQNLATQLNGLTDPTQYQQADRVAQTQADLARVPDVAMRTLDAVGLRNRSTQDFLANSSATASQNANLLDLAVTDHNPTLAKELATAYATQFARYRADLDTAPLQKARREVSQRVGCTYLIFPQIQGFCRRLSLCARQVQGSEARRVHKSERRGWAGDWVVWSNRTMRQPPPT